MGIKYGTGDTNSLGIYGGSIGLWPSPYLAGFIRCKISSSPQDNDTYFKLYAGSTFGVGRVFDMWHEGTGGSDLDIEQGSENTRYRWTGVSAASTFATYLVCFDMTDSSVPPDLYYNGDFVTINTTVTNGTGINRWTSDNRSGIQAEETNLLVGCDHLSAIQTANEWTFYETAIFCSHKPLSADFANLLMNERIHPLNFKGCVGFMDWTDYPYWQNQAFQPRCRTDHATTPFFSGDTLPSYIEDEPPYFRPFSKIKRTIIPHTKSFTKFTRILKTGGTN